MKPTGACGGRVADAAVFDEPTLVVVGCQKRVSFVLVDAHRQFHAEPDGQTILEYTVVGRMPYVSVELADRRLLMNLDTGASEWMTIPPAMVDSLAWQTAPRPGRMTTNNQTGATRVLEGTAAGVLTLGPIRVTEPPVYVNPDVDDAWLGSSAMMGAVWTFDVANRRVAITLGNPH